MNSARDAEVGCDKLDADIDQFESALLADIAAGRQRLPPWSQETGRLVRMLIHNQTRPGQWAKALASSPHMVVKVMHVAGAPLFGRAAHARADLKDAVAHLGHQRMLWLIYASGLAQIRNSPRLQHLRPQLLRLADSSANTAAVAWLLAQRSADVSADEAVLSGLLHNVGKLCLLASLDTASELYRDKRRRIILLARSHARVAAALIRQHGLPEWLASAIAAQEQEVTDASPRSMLGEILAASVAAARTVETVAETAAHLSQFTQLNLKPEDWRALLHKVPATANVMRELFSE